MVSTRLASSQAVVVCRKCHATNSWPAVCKEAKTKLGKTLAEPGNVPGRQARATTTRGEHMVTIEKKKAVRTADQMAKAAMKALAISDLQANGLGTEVKVTVEYMGIRHSLLGTPTVKLETGEIGFYCGARGRSALPFETRDKDGKERSFSFGMGLNVSTGFGIENHEAILKKYNLELVPAGKSENDQLDEGETTLV